MEKLKDFIYDKNDILIALMIILIAGFAMFNRIDTIMTYPTTMAAEMLTGGSKAKPPAVDTSESDDPEGSDTENGSQGTNSDGDAGSAVSGAAVSNPTGGAIYDKSGNLVNHSLYVNPGDSAAKIGDNLAELKIAESREEFVNAVNAAGVASKLKSGTFIIPSNATLEQAIAILTN